MKIGRGWTTIATVSFVTLVFITLTVATSFAKSAKPITLNFVSFVPLANKVEYQFLKDEFIDKVNKQAKGELIIKTRGGPEVIAPFDLGVAVQKGTIDLATIPTAFFESMVPGADSTKLSIYTAWEERKNGIYEYIRDMYTKAGLYYLGRGEATTPEYFNMFINKRIQKPKDFAGLKLGGSTAFHGQYKRLGASVTTLAIPEYHSAMERGVVDGLCSSIYVAHQFGMLEATKYLVTPGFYISPVMVIFNLKSWNKIPGDMQKVLTGAMSDFEGKFTPFESGERAKALEAAQKMGVKILDLSPEMAKWYLNAATAREDGNTPSRNGAISFPR